MKDLIIWSGGMDSTALIIDRVAQGRDDFETLYIHLENNDAKSRWEWRRRKRMKSLIRTRYGIEFKDHCVKLEALHPSIDSIVTLWQPTIWIWGLFNFFSNRQNFDKLLMGYVKGDCFWHVKDKILNLYQAMYESLHHPREGLDKRFPLPEIVFPYEWFSKEKISEYVYKQDIDLFNLTWTCENPINRKECGKCNTCTNFSEVVGKLQTQDIIHNEYKYVGIFPSNKILS